MMLELLINIKRVADHSKILANWYKVLSKLKVNFVANTCGSEITVKSL